MTGAAGIALPGVGQTSADAPATTTSNELAKQAAAQFEGLIVRELMKVLRKTVPESAMTGSGFAGQMYTEMLDDALADELGKGHGLGLRDMLEESLGGSDSTGAASDGTTAIPLDVFDRVGHLAETVRRIDGYGSYTPEPPDYTEGAAARVRQAAEAMMAAGSDARWAREGQLSEQDLASDFATGAVGSEARFNVRDANGYQGYYKCNLFAFEMARRAGFQVPVVGRARGWGFPAPNRITHDASDGQVQDGWARVASHEAAGTMDGDLRQGRRAFLLTGAATGERAGHMAMVERIHQIDRHRDGRIRRIVFDGWEARSQGAEHLRRRTWNVAGNPGGSLARNGFEQIEVLEMRSVGQGETAEIPLSSRAGPSRRDISFSRSQKDRPINSDGGTP